MNFAAVNSTKIWLTKKQILEYFCPYAKADTNLVDAAVWSTPDY